MCGIAGIYALPSSAWSENLPRHLEAQGQALAYRGPDAGQIWCDPEAGIGLSHRRLAILDLSPLGVQPMRSHCGRFVICYNGEIYNFAELRAELEALGHRFKGSSDTEVMLQAIATYGLEESLSKFAGMFAFALWDQREKKLFLVRDRLGIKPLYYTQTPQGLAFGSELKALTCLPDFDRQIDPAAVSCLLQHIYIGGELAIYKNTHKLKPGHLIELDPEALQSKQTPKQRAWWKLEDQLEGEQLYSPANAGQAVDDLESLLSQVVAQHMCSDVPLGAFLSGGVDSSTVAALMQKQSSQPINSFSIGFDAPGLNEAEHAKEVAKHIGSQHTELYVGDRELLDVVPLLADMYDEPFADSSQIPTYLVSKLAKQKVTVSLSGDGGDELFCGYKRYFVDQGSAQRLQSLPAPLPALVAGLLHGVPSPLWSLAEASLERVAGRQRFSNLANKAQRFADFIQASPDDAYRQLLLQWRVGKEPLDQNLLNQDARQALPWPDLTSSDGFDTHQRWRQYADTLTYLPNDILTKVDRASMAVSLEARVPLLDHRVLEFAWHCSHQLLTGGPGLEASAGEPQGKWLLRQVLYRHVPRGLIDRPKKGFGVPLGDWLSGPLRDWSESLLAPNALAQSGMLDTPQIQRCWQQHRSGQANHQARLWPILMFQAWHQRWA